MLFFIKRALKAISLSVFVLAPPVTVWAADVVSPELGSGLTELKSGTADKFMVVAANPLAAEAGAKILRAGGCIGMRRAERWSVMTAAKRPRRLRRKIGS